MKQPDPHDRDDAILWARNVFSKKEQYLICDTETSGIKDNDEIIQMSVIDMEGNVLYDTLLRPKEKKNISKEATLLHGLKMSDLMDAPYFETAVHKFKEVVREKTVLFYNAEFDVRLIRQTIYANSCAGFELDYWCVMKEYAKYFGEWNDYHQDYKRQKLTGGNHTALGDCLATLKLLERMANSELLFPEEPVPVISDESLVDKKTKKWWQFWN